MSFFLSEPLDFEKHNEEVSRVWKAFKEGNPCRVPVSVSGSITNYLLNPELNTKAWSFKDFFEKPEIQIKAQLEYQKWQRFNLCCDRAMGLPEKKWTVGVDFQNSYEAGWMGCSLRYFEGQLPDTCPIFEKDKEKLYDLPAEVPFDNGLQKRILEFQDCMIDACKNMDFEGRKVEVSFQVPGEGTDGPFDLAYKLRGAENLLLDMMTDEKYYHDLMCFITENIIRRIKALRQRRWEKFPASQDKGHFKRPNFSFADDAIALISCEHYREFVYPYHRRIIEEFSDGTAASIHLCGDASRHFKFLRDHLNFRSFDTGFPIDHGKLRKELGDDAQINGGPTVMLVKDGTAKEIEAEVKKICGSGVMKGGRFVMIAANNLAPRTPVENVKALYEATKAYGKYR